MNTIIKQDNTIVVVDNDHITINGISYGTIPGKGNNITVVNNKVYINGYELRKDQWKKTFAAWWFERF